MAVSYLYFLTLPLLLIGIVKPDKWKVKLVAHIIQTVLFLIAMIGVLIDDWCSIHLYKFLIALP